MRRLTIIALTLKGSPGLGEEKAETSGDSDEKASLFFNPLMLILEALQFSCGETEGEFACGSRDLYFGRISL